MPAADLPAWAAPVLGFVMVFLAGLIRGFTGFGFSVAAVPLLGLLMSPAQAVPIVLLLQLFVGLNGFGEALRICDWRSIRALSLGALVATPFGAWGLARLPEAPVRLAIAAIVAAAVAILWRGVRMASAPGGIGALLFGVASGLFNGVAGMPGPPVITFYLTSPLGTGVARASLIVFFFVTSVFALAPLAAFGLLGRHALVASLLGIPAVWLGAWLGALLYRTSPERYYRPAALALLAATALLAAARAVLDLVA